MTAFGRCAQRGQEFVAIDAVLLAGVVHRVKAEIGQPTHPILKSRKTRMVAGRVVMTSPTISSKPIGIRVSISDDLHERIRPPVLCSDATFGATRDGARKTRE